MKPEESRDIPGPPRIRPRDTLRGGGPVLKSSGLAFPLTSSELHKAPLVYLSACETARDMHGNNGGDLFSFASCLLRIGSGCVIGAIWTVRDDCAHAFTKGFYDGLTSTHDPAEAFCIAVRHVKSYLTTPPKGSFSSNKGNVKTIDWAGFMPFMSV